MKNEKEFKKISDLQVRLATLYKKIRDDVISNNLALEEIQKVILELNNINQMLIENSIERHLG